MTTGEEERTSDMLGQSLTNAFPSQQALASLHPVRFGQQSKDSFAFVVRRNCSESAHQDFAAVLMENNQIE